MSLFIFTMLQCHFLSEATPYRITLAIEMNLKVLSNIINLFQDYEQFQGRWDFLEELCIHILFRQKFKFWHNDIAIITTLK